MGTAGPNSALRGLLQRILITRDRGGARRDRPAADISNIISGFLLAIGLLQRVPRVGDDPVRANTTITPFAWVVGVVALVAGAYYLIVHLTSGPHVFHFEVIEIAVGVALLWDRPTGGPAPDRGTVPF